MTELAAVGVSSGFGMGRAYILEKQAYEIPFYSVSDTGKELARFENALCVVIEETRFMTINAEGSKCKSKAEILDAYLMLLEDPATTEGVRGLINASYNSVFAVKKGIDEIIELFDRMENAYMRERVYDIMDIQNRLIRQLLGFKAQNNEPVPPGSIIIAEDLTTSDTAKMNLENVAGIITVIGGQNSHTSIVARSMEIPAVICGENIFSLVNNGDEVLLDGGAGKIFIHPTEQASIEFKKRKQEYIKEKNYIKKLIGCPTMTRDRIRCYACANISSLDEISRVHDSDSDGIGLFRSEFLFTDRYRYPDEDVQFEVYRSVAVSMAGKPVTIRTMDLGGDKAFVHLNTEAESNPALGYRAIRIHLDRRDLLKTQLRAILRASYYGNLNINLPMISSLDELRAAKSVLDEAKRELRLERKGFNSDIMLGVMIEIPSAAILSDHLARECSFLSIGTNDLIQYTTAVDRSNGKVSHLYTHYNPAVLQLIAKTISAANNASIDCSMCGEAAGDPLLVPAFLGMGLRSFSTNTGIVLKNRALLAAIDLSEAQALAKEVLSLGTADEVRSVLENFARRY